MDPIQLRREIEDEMRRTRLDKTRLYDLLLKIVDTSVGGEASAGPQGPAGPKGPAGPAGPQGPAGVCKCVCTKVEEAPKKKATTTATSSKKKASTTE